MTTNPSVYKDRVDALIQKSVYISRDLSWLQFNHRVLDQAKNKKRNVLEQLKFIAITASNLDEFFMVRVGSLYNYIDYDKQRLDYSGLREDPFRATLLEQLQELVQDQYSFYLSDIAPKFPENNFSISNIEDLTENERTSANEYFLKTVFPMLTPMVSDAYHTFPMLMNKLLCFGVVTKEIEDGKENNKLSFVQIPQNLPRFYEIFREDEMVFVPIESIIKANIDKLFRNVSITSVNLLRITRNGDYTLEESEDLETDFIDEIKRKLKTRKTGRVVRLEVEPNANKWMMQYLSSKWDIDGYNVFEVPALIDFTCIWQIVNHSAFKYHMPSSKKPVTPITLRFDDTEDNIFNIFKERDVLLHHPYNSIEPLLKLIEAAAEDPNVLAIKITIYRVAKDSRITNALYKAAENGKHVSVLFEIKARFDEENNIREAKRLQDAGCFVIHGIGYLKTHTKMLLIVRKEGDKVTRYVHMSSGNYNEDTSRLYTDIGFITTKEIYAHDVSEFFNAITGHSNPQKYDYLLTAPISMRTDLISLIRQEAKNAKAGLPSGIIVKVNSLQDDKFIDALYKASQAGVPIKLIVRGICCLRPSRKGLSENIEVKSIVGNYLEHSRIFYFHNNGDPKVYGGSADAMVRSFDRRIESLFLFVDEKCKKETMTILDYSLRDNVNTYIMQEDGTYIKPEINNEKPFDAHKEFYKLSEDAIKDVTLF
ncbi:polyphosphate kinase 1 [Chondrinema litorale]|uniref:polyphosphate kinase 1 n=1 Tax=Chondrinema litorale TaxID=2994555 RepID=UPI002543DA00|nr:polyphosphate kinase 1 [Chondrinema litorale]UZR96236.1 polyphosphate kinase 1 [Chondrinema litorale]